MSKQTLIFITVFAVFGIALVAGYFVYDRTRQTEADSISKYSPAATADSKISESKTEQSPQSQNAGLQVQGTSTSNSKDPNRLLNPDEFSEYEKAANQQSTSYIDIKKGEGGETEPGDKVFVVYKGWLTNGELFDQSRKNEVGQTETFEVTVGAGQVIRGWDDGLVGMREGGKRRLIIPAAFGYGEMGQGPIPPNSMLIFDVELIEVQKKDINPPGAILP